MSSSPEQCKRTPSEEHSERDIKEGRDEVEPRHAMDPEEPAELKEATGRHVPPEPLQEPDPETAASLCLLPIPALHQGQNKQTQRKRKPFSEKCQKENPQPPKLKKLEKKWNFITFNFISKIINNDNKNNTNDENNSIGYEQVPTTYILDFIKTISESLNDTNYNLKESSHILEEFFKKFNNCAEIFLKNVLDNKYCQQAFAILKRTDDSCIEIGPFKPKKTKHSEDDIIDKIKTFIEEEKDLSEIWIYTTNNPCLGRQHHPPCMCTLINFSHEHKINMYVGYSKSYVFCKNMHKCIEELEKAEPGNGESFNWNPNYKFQVKFDSKGFKDTHKKIQINDREGVCNIIEEIVSKYSTSVLTYKEWNKTEMETVEELESELKEKVTDVQKVITVYKEWWALTVNENLNRFVVPGVLQHIQDREPHIQFFHINPDRFSSDKEEWLHNEE